jgi:hypothetical protein
LVCTNSKIEFQTKNMPILPVFDKKNNFTGSNGFAILILSHGMILLGGDHLGRGFSLPVPAPPPSTTAPWLPRLLMPQNLTPLQYAISETVRREEEEAEKREKVRKFICNYIYIILHLVYSF